MYIENVYERFIVSRWAYLMGSPIISDIEYDSLEKEFKATYPDDVYSNQSWSFDECPIALLQKYGLSDMICNPVMGYMAESIDSINEEGAYRQQFINLNEKTRLSFKIDGWNTRVSYFNGFIHKVETRGRSGNNLSMNNIGSMFPKTIPIKGRVAITGEMSIPNSKWEEFKDITGNNDQRASVRTALAKGMSDYLEFLGFNIFIEDGMDKEKDPYELITELGFKTPKFIWVNNFNELEKGLKYMSYISKAYGYLTDGLVIENSKYQLAIRLGEWQEHTMCSYVTGYEETQGMYGVFMNVLCKPIKIEGKRFGKISINNIANIVENHLAIGMPIAFNLRSSANVVIDVTNTRKLQDAWRNNLQGYKDAIDKQNV